MSGSRQISPTSAGWPARLLLSGRGLRRRRGLTAPVVFGARRGAGAAVLGGAPAGSSARPWPCCWRGSRESAGDAGPGFAAAQEAQHAALNLELVGADRLDRRAVELSVLGVVDLAFPGIDAGLLLHVDQDRHAQGRPALFGDIRIVLVRPPGVFSQATDAPHVAAALGDRMLATPSATFQSPVGSAASAGARPVAKKTPE